MLLFTAFSQTLKQIVHLLVTRKASFEPTQGSGAKEPRAGIYSERSDCALLIATIPLQDLTNCCIKVFWSGSMVIMSELGHSSREETNAFADAHSIDTRSDIAMISGDFEDDPTYPLLALLNEQGETVQHINELGAEYDFSQLDYVNARRIVKASRFIATILAGNRTELAYWTADAPAKQLTVHQGEGTLLISKPDDTVADEIPLNPEVASEVILPPGRFYTFIAKIWTPKVLVISGLYKEKVDWDELEVAFDPTQQSIITTDGTITVPNDFIAKSESPNQSR
jgi:hypothetical protein